MKPILYHFTHCPFCIRVRMAAGYLKIDFDTKQLRYDDEVTPVKLTGKKILPAWVDENGKAINESLDIIALIDSSDKLKTKKILSSPEWKNFETKLNAAGTFIHNLAMPHFIYTKEFDEESRAYFQKKKEIKRGPFGALIKNRKQFEKELALCLNDFEKDITDYYNSNELSVYDIALASHLWGMYVVPEFQFSNKVHAYLQRVKDACHFDYHKDLW